MAKLLSGTRIYGTGTVDTQLFVSGTNAASSTITGALQVVGGIGVGGASYFGSSVTAPTFIGNLTGTATNALLATTSTNLVGGLAGSLPYQTGAGATTMLALGTNGYVLTAGATAPQWTPISGLSAGNATTSTNLAGGTAGQTPYQASPGVTSFYGPGTTGQLLMSSGTNAPQYVSTASINVGRSDLAITASNVAGGAGGSLVYQSASGTTAMLGIATTAGYVLSSTGSLPQWASLNSLGAGSATTSTHIAGGTAGQVPYQTGPGLTSFFGPGTAGQVLVSNGTSAPSYSSNLSLTTVTATTFVGNLTGTATTATTATNADSVKTVAQSTNASYYPTFVDANNATAAYEALYTTSSFVINPQSGNVGIGESDPLRKFVVRSDSSGSITAIGIYNGSTATSNGSVISFRSDTTGTGAATFQEFAGFSTTYTDKNHATRSADFNIFTANSGTVATRVIVKSTGNVGIGTSTPLSKFVVNGGTVDSTTYTSSEARIADGTLHLMKTSAGGVFEALRAINNDTTVGTTVRLLAAATSDPFNNGNGGKVFIDAVRTAANMDLVFSLNDAGGAAAVERLRLLGSGALAFNGASNYGSSGQVLQSNGNAAPTWVSIGGLAAGTATTATNVAITNDTSTITPQFLAFVSTSTGNTGIKTAAISGLNYIPSSGYHGIGINPPTAPLHIVGSVSSILKFRGASTGQIGILYSDANQASLTDNAGSEAYAILPTTNALVMSTNATNRITVDLSGQVKVLANIEATAVSTGSLVVTGGVGISGNLYAGGLINGGNGARITGIVTATTFVGNLTGNASGTASALSGGAAGSLPYQTGASTTGFLAIGTAGYFLTAGATAPQWTQTLGVANGGTGATTISGVVYGNGTSAFTAATGAQISTALGSTNISGSAANVTGTVLTSNGGTGLTSWTAGDLPYYASGTALSKLAISTSGYVLTSSGTAPQWTLASGLSAGSSASATNIAGGNTNQIPYQSGPGATAFSANLTWTNGTNTLSATGTINAAGALTRTGAVSSTAWTTTSPVFHNAGTLLTDTSSAVGTVSARVGVSLHSPNFAATNAITVTDAVNLYVQAPVASTNVTATRSWAIYNQGNEYINGNLGIGSTNLVEKLTVNGAIRAYAPANTTINFSNVDSDSATYTNRNDRVLTSNGTNWAADGKDPILTLTRSNAGTTRGQSIGLLLHNENSTINSYSPLIGFSAVSNSGSYNSMYAAIMGKKTGANAGVDTNWNKGELHFYAGGDVYMNDTPNMIINGTGVVIGATATTNKFEVVGTSGQLFSVSDSFAGTIFSVNDVSGMPSIEVLDTGLVKIAQYSGQVAISTGTVASGSALTVNGIISTIGTGGEIRASSEVTAYYSSDARLKENVTVISKPIEMLNQIRGVYFDWTDKHIEERGGEDGVFVRKHDVGVIAQEIEAILPEIVTTRDTGYKAVRYEKLVPLLIEAIKAQQNTIDSLVNDLKDVKEFINLIKNNKQ